MSKRRKLSDDRDLIDDKLKNDKPTDDKPKDNKPKDDKPKDEKTKDELTIFFLAGNETIKTSSANTTMYLTQKPFLRKML